MIPKAAFILFYLQVERQIMQIGGFMLKLEGFADALNARGLTVDEIAERLNIKVSRLIGAQAFKIKDVYSCADLMGITPAEFVDRYVFKA